MTGKCCVAVGDRVAGWCCSLLVRSLLFLLLSLSSLSSLMAFCFLLLQLCSVFLLPLATMTTSQVFAVPVAAAELQHSALFWQSTEFCWRWLYS